MTPGAAALDSETRDLLALHLLPGLGPRLTKALLERFGSAASVLKASASELRAVPHIGDHLAQKLVEAMRALNIEPELELLQKHQVRVVPAHSSEYPASLKTIADPPGLLYVRGSLDAADQNAVAIVGSRHCTSYGRRIAERLAEELARAGWTVISGLARGIDAAAHRGALNAGGRTLAVLAGGLSQIYPPEHADLADEVAESGAIVSESPMAMAPMSGMFPARNRLISGMSRGVVVVEAAHKSGALLTARHAAEQGRDVFAVPGPVDSPASGGTLQLLKDGAILARNAEDILSVWGAAPRRAGVTPGSSLPEKAKPSLVGVQQQVWEALGQEAVHADELVQRLGVGVSELGTTLMMLEMQGVVRRLPGNRFERR
jgi:DNA processing protein